MTPYRLSLVEGCRLVASGGSPRFETPRGAVTLTDPTPAMRNVLNSLLRGDSTEAQCLALATDGGDDVGGGASGGYAGLTWLYGLLFDLHQRLLLVREVWNNGSRMASAQALSPAWKFAVDQVEEDTSFVLSRFALVRRIGDALHVESPCSLARITLYDPRAVGLIAELARPRNIHQLVSAAPEVEPLAPRLLVDLLWHADLLSPVGAKGEEEDLEANLRPWEFHDLLFHSRSRDGRHDEPYGLTYEFRGEVDPPPALKPAMVGKSVELHRPDLDQLRGADLSLTQVLEQRRSGRQHAAEAITDRQLGEFLYRAARARQTMTVDSYEMASRVYPGGGSAYELELYPVIAHCQGLDPGLYHYRAGEHRLTRLSGLNRNVEGLLGHASKATRTDAPIQILIVISARFQRLSWKYRSITYATVLKDVGALYQTLYLVGTAMGLATCAVGGGDSDLFAQTISSDYYEETSVGEFILGAL